MDVGNPLVAGPHTPASNPPLRRMAAAPGHAQHRHRGFDGFGTEARVHQDVNALGLRLGSGLRYSMLDANHVVGVGVMAQECDRVVRERWCVCCCPANPSL